jgi:PPOX class probable F420-dependent enzyme
MTEPMGTTDAFTSFAGYKNLSLESFRKTGVGVPTPVWFAMDPANGTATKLYVYTIADSGKAKRIRNNGRVRIAPCDWRGKILGDWLEAKAGIIDGTEATHGMELLNKKYFPLKQIMSFFAGFSARKRIVIRILPA